MTAQVLPLTTPDRLTRSQRHAYGSRRLAIGTSAVVHAVAWETGPTGEDMAVPACGQAFGGHLGALAPTSRPTTCRRCRRQAGDDADPSQPPLW